MTQNGCDHSSKLFEKHYYTYILCRFKEEVQKRYRLKSAVNASDSLLNKHSLKSHEEQHDLFNSFFAF